MPVKDPAVDAYIKNSAAFAQPVLIKIRNLVHRACPGVEETIKWGFPNFMISGSIMCSMASFKNHCSFGFWKASLLQDKHAVLKISDKNGMGNLDKITDLSQLPADSILIGLVKEAAMLNEQKIKKPTTRRKTAATILPVPPYLKKALKGDKQAETEFLHMSTSHKNEYIEWITEAKTEPTRNKRVAQTLEWLREGKSRNWQYQKAR